MRRIENRKIMGITGLILGGGFCASLVSAAWRPEGPAAAHGAYTAVDIARMSERVCHEVAPELPCRAFTIDWSNSGVARDAASTADCTAFLRADAADSSAEIYFRWNLATGHLLTVSRAYPLCGGRGCLPATEAVRRSERWLRDLAMVPADAPLRLAGPPERNGIAWVVRFTTGGRSAIARVSLADGTLQAAELSP